MITSIKLRVALAAICFSFATEASATPVFDAIKNAADTAYYGAQAAYQAAKKVLDIQLADAQAMVGIKAKEQIAVADQNAQTTRDTLNHTNQVAKDSQQTVERCGTSATSPASTAGKLEAVKLTAIKSGIHVQRSNLMNSPGEQTIKAANDQIDKYCDVTDPLCRAASVKPDSLGKMDTGASWAGRNQQASSLTSGAGNENIKGERLSFSRDQLKAAEDYKNKIADGVNQPQALSPSQTKTPEGIRYEVARGDYVAKRSIALGVLDAEIEGKRPNAELYQTLKNMSGITPSTSKYVSKVITDSLNQIDNNIVDEKGNKGVSADDLMRIEFTRRADSPEWYKMMDEFTSDVPVLKELAFMNAANLKMQYLIHQQQKTALLMQAQTVLENIDSTTLAQLNQMRAVAVANQR